MDRARAGMTLIELVVVLAVIGAMLALASSMVSDWSADQRVATSAREVADAFSLARSEAIRTGSNQILAFQVEAGLDGITSNAVIVNDGPTGNTAGSSNCRIDAGEIVDTITLEQGVRFGSDPGLANGTAAPNDVGASGDQATGSSFTTPSGANASWVMFGPDGLPRQFDQSAATTPPCDQAGSPGNVGAAGGAIYLTNGHRDYAIVMSPLGTVRLHRWNSGAAAWTQ
ncbi:MAG TPA: prepilin-type N-terminal cleavage/methylation domain-containing protein [Myxococcota bacterium]|nr:prepilin-type N-terminal cleavage/methylation domain-containing protein [Myxococcota bacterium]